VWKNTECVQTLQLPSTVWDVTSLANGDVAVACADWIARVYTRDTKRVATSEVKAAFEKRLLEAAQPKQNKVGDLDLDSVQGYDALQQDGTQEGQTKVACSPCCAMKKPCFCSSFFCVGCEKARWNRGRAVEVVAGELGEGGRRDERGEQGGRNRRRRPTRRIER
jgi:hypothetical protein